MPQEMTHRQSRRQSHGTSRWRLPTGVYNPVVAPDGRRWLDYEKAAEVPAQSLEEPPPRVHAPIALAGGPDWFDRPTRPPRLDLARPYGVPGGLAEPDSQAQRDLDQAVGGRFPDPRGTWIRLINAEGPSEDPFRSTNAVDCALSVLSTWHGEPIVAAPRLPEHDESGAPVLTGEAKGVSRAERWIGHRFEYVGHGRRAYAVIGRRLLTGGHGAAAILITRWPSGGSHAWNAVNSYGEIVWIDAQRGHMAVEPPYADVTGVFSVIIDREGLRL
ncbi:toxin glutamine deamidase domain-containing protein [Microtetraspora malaysiensis]|uniref:toxin glutamine deamidase domain-containing protein n=1 Tax=Microtetraspora malaysiensis TaxID=161358 RepID=UPI000A6177CC|nr:toxin glutamine deamidase domain-containing protein [Microtetraspora malaysiensis]